MVEAQLAALLHSALAMVVHIDRSSRRRPAVVLGDGVSVIREAVHVGHAAAAAAVTGTGCRSPAATSDRPTGGGASVLARSLGKE